MPIRPHTLADANGIADILAEGWKIAYAGFMPEPLFLPRIDKARRRADIIRWLADEFKPDVEHVLVAENEGIDGFIHLVLEDKAGLGAAAHINLLYVRPDRFRRGIGRALVIAAADWLAARTTGSIVLGAYADNPYRDFYARIGGVEALRKTVDFEGHALESVYYRWDDATALQRGAAGNVESLPSRSTRR